jgi:hypothetical protein
MKIKLSLTLACLRICATQKQLVSFILFSKFHSFLYFVPTIGLYLTNVKRNLLATRTRGKISLPLHVRIQLFIEVPIHLIVT